MAVGSTGAGDAVAVGVEGNRVGVGDAVGVGICLVGVILGTLEGVALKTTGVFVGIRVGATVLQGNAPAYPPFSPPVQAGELDDNLRKSGLAGSVLMKSGFPTVA